MDKYPTLKEMGITRPHQIAHYSMRLAGKNRDVLHVFYQREKGSLLAASRKYEFGRAAKNVASDNQDQEFEEVFEISPFLLKAVAELDSIIGTQEDHQSLISVMKKELDCLEQLVQSRIEEIRNQLDELQS